MDLGYETGISDARGVRRVFLVVWQYKHAVILCLVQVTTVRRTTNPTVELFRHTHNAGPYHSMDFFTFGGSLVNETYIGQSTVRGIPVRGWYRRIVQKASAFHPPYEQEEFRMDVFYYFSEESWTYPPWNMSGIPVRIRVQGDAVEVADPARLCLLLGKICFFFFRTTPQASKKRREKAALMNVWHRF